MSILYPSRVRTITCLACGGQVPGTPAGLAALPECYDLSLSDDERIEALATAFFAPGHDPSVWLSGWFPDTAAGEGAAGNPENFFLGGPQEMLIIQGSQDAVAPPGNAQELKASRAPTTKLVTVYAGHALMPEQPDIIVGEVRTFLEAH
jgi:pimeloyl-ACP methyl ester carboxylesterase